MVFVACTVHVYSEYAMLNIDISMYTANVTLQKQRYEVHTKIGMISLFTLSIPKTV